MKKWTVGCILNQSKLTTSCIVLNLLDMMYVEKQVVIFIYVETYFFSKMSIASNNCLLVFADYLSN